MKQIPTNSGSINKPNEMLADFFVNSPFFKKRYLNLIIHKNRLSLWIFLSKFKKVVMEHRKDGSNDSCIYTVNLSSEQHTAQKRDRERCSLDVIVCKNRKRCVAASRWQYEHLLAVGRIAAPPHQHPVHEENKGSGTRPIFRLQIGWVLHSH